MKSLMTTTALVLTATLAVGQCSNLTITGSVNPGQTVNIDLTGATANTLALLGVGQAGSTTFNLGPLGSITVDLASPFSLFPIGVTNASGDVSLSIAVPSNIPAGMLPNETFTAQAVTVSVTTNGPGGPGGPPLPTLTVCLSNTAALVVGSG